MLKSVSGYFHKSKKFGNSCFRHVSAIMNFCLRFHWMCKSECRVKKPKVNTNNSA